MGNLSDSSFGIRMLHKYCNSSAKILPDKVKDEAEIESLGILP
jgi:hypothetical protein